MHSSPQDTLPDVNILEYLSPELQKNLIKRHKKGININKLLIELLQKHDAEIEEEKETLSKEAGPVKFRYIKVRVRKVLRAEHGNRCSMPHCNKKAPEAAREVEIDPLEAKFAKIDNAEIDNKDT